MANLPPQSQEKSGIRPAVSGFTLVEISGIIVIIGLLVGGIILGREILRQADIRKTIRQLEMYKIAFNLYRENYDAMPGDHMGATSYWAGRTTDGNGDGMIWDYQSGNGNGQFEDLRAIQHLTLAEYINYGYFENLDLPYLIGGNVPPSNIQGAGYRYVGHPWSSATLLPYDQQSMYGKFGAGLLLASEKYDLYGPALSTEQAWQIDSKMDDGQPATGKIFSLGDPNEGPPDNCVIGQSNRFDAGQNEYNLSYEYVACILEYWLD